MSLKALAIQLLCYTVLAPIAAVWAWSQERRITKHGEPLTEDQLEWAKKMGIKNPQKIHIIRQARLSFPTPNWVNCLLKKLGFQLVEAAGMSLRYGIFISDRIELSPRLLCHEMAHTLQYEQLGGLYFFMQRYLFECIYLGYNHAPMEKDADIQANKVLQAKSS